MGNLNVYSPTIPLETTTQYSVDTTYSTIYIYWSSAGSGLQYGLIRAQELGLIGKTLVITVQGSANRLAFWSCSQENPYPSEANIGVPATHTYDSTTETHTYNVTPQTNGNYVLITGYSTANRKYVAIPTTDITITAPDPMWQSYDIQYDYPSYKYTTTSHKSINKYGQRNSQYIWTFTYAFNEKQAVSEYIAYIPAESSERTIEFLTAETNVAFFYGTTSTPEGECTVSFKTIGNYRLYSVTIPANKVCFPTKYLSGTSTSTTTSTYYQTMHPDSGWLMGVIHKTNGTSWD